MTGVAIARWVPARLGVRCGAPGCGEKIKPVTPEDMMAEVMWDDGDQSFVEPGLVLQWSPGPPGYWRSWRHRSLAGRIGRAGSAEGGTVTLTTEELDELERVAQLYFRQNAEDGGNRHLRVDAVSMLGLIAAARSDLTRSEQTASEAAVLSGHQGRLRVAHERWVAEWDKDRTSPARYAAEADVARINAGRATVAESASVQLDAMRRELDAARELISILRDQNLRSHAVGRLLAEYDAAKVREGEP